jgi:ribonuclease Z
VFRYDDQGRGTKQTMSRTMLPKELAAAGISGPDVGRLQREGSLRGVRLQDVSLERPGQRFAFIMDTAPCEGAAALAEGADLLVTESTFSDADDGLARQYAHLTAGQAGDIAAAGRAGTLVLTHFSSRYGDVVPLAEQASARAGGATVIAANDFDRIRVPKRPLAPSRREAGT